MRALLAAALLAWPVPAGRAAEFAPVARAQLMGGQYYFSGEKASLSGNASVLVAPAARLSDAALLVPVLASSYQGTKQVVDLVGAGTLFQEQMEHRASLRAVFTPSGSRWRLKPNAGFAFELCKETRDETWGRGLFDSRRLGLGFEAEYVYREPYAVRLAADYVHIAFPNYASLESQAGLDPLGQPLARELAGRRVLDQDVLSVLAAGAVGLGRFALEGRLREQRSSFPGQHLVDASGALGEPTREDYLTSLSAALRMPAELNTDLRLLGSFELGWSVNISNQSSYDARRARYLDGYYKYSEVRTGASAQLLWGDPRDPIKGNLGLSWTRRGYARRPPQDGTGVYGEGGVGQDTWTLSASAAVPVASGFGLLMDWRWSRATSNQSYQRAYAYNYSAMDYLFGISYEY